MSNSSSRNSTVESLNEYNSILNFIDQDISPINYFSSIDDSTFVSRFSFLNIEEANNIDTMAVPKFEAKLLEIIPKF